MSYGLKDVLSDAVTGNLETVSPVVQNIRKEICQGCKDYRRVTHQCAVCGCFIDVKVKLLKAECPKEKW